MQFFGFGTVVIRLSHGTVMPNEPLKHFSKARMKWSF